MDFKLLHCCRTVVEQLLAAIITIVIAVRAETIEDDNDYDVDDCGDEIKATGSSLLRYYISGTGTQSFFDIVFR